LLCLYVRKRSQFDPGDEAIKKLLNIVTYAMIISVFFVLLELFTAFYSQIPSHMEAFHYQFFGLEGHGKLMPFMWLCAILGIAATFMLLSSKSRTNERFMKLTCLFVFFSLWLEKGMGLVITGFIPSPFNTVTEYFPTLPELAITLAVWATGFLILTILYKVAIAVKEETA